MDSDAGKSAARAAIVMPAVFALADKVIGAAADLDLRGLRLVRAARARRVHRPAADSPRRVPRAGVRRRRLHHARDALLATRLARGRRDGDRRLCDALRGRRQRLLRGGRDRRAPDLRPAGDASGAELGDPGAPRRVGAGGRRRHFRTDAALAASSAGRLAARGRRRAACRRRPARRRPRELGRTCTRCARVGRRSGAASPRGPAPPDRPDRPDGRPRLASRRARLAPLVSHARSGSAARAGLRRGRRSDGGGRRHVLRASAERLEGRDGQPDFERLETARDDVARALMRRLPELPAEPRRARCRGRSTRRSEFAR